MTDNREYLIKVVDYFGSQSELSRVLDVSRDLVSKWVNGKYSMQLKHALKIQLLTKGKFKYFKLIDRETRCYLMNK